MRVKNEEEAIRLANDSIYGLTAMVWSRDPERAERIARRLEAGTVSINDCGAGGFGICEAPWLGVKESGFGIVHSEDGMRNFCRQKHLIVDRGLMQKLMGREFYWFPNNTKSYKMLTGIIDLFYSRGSKKLRALFGNRK